MKYKVIYEISYKISNNEWVRVGLNQEADDDLIPHYQTWDNVKACCELMMTQVVKEAKKEKS